MYQTSAEYWIDTGVSPMLSSAISRAHASSSSPSTRRTSAKASPASGRGNAIATSCSVGAASRPAADSTPGWRGISTLPMPSSAASAVAWIGPAPPSATSVKRRGSRPRRIETSRMPSTICAFTTRWMPSAASSTDRPRGRAIRCSITSRARDGSSETEPPAKYAGSSQPSTTDASVTVASSPPRP